MINWRWDKPRAFGDQVDRSNLPTTSSGKVQRTSEYFSWYGSDDLWARIESPSCWQYKPGNFLAVGPQHWDEIIDEDDDDVIWVDPRAPSSGKSRPSDGNDNSNGMGKEDTQGGGKGTRKEKGSKDRKEKGKGKVNGKGEAMVEWKGNRKGNVKGKGIVKQTPGGDDISRAVALQWHKEMYKADLDTEGLLEWVYL